MKSTSFVAPGVAEKGRLRSDWPPFLPGPLFLRAALPFLLPALPSSSSPTNHKGYRSSRLPPLLSSSPHLVETNIMRFLFDRVLNPPSLALPIPPDSRTNHPKWVARSASQTHPVSAPTASRSERRSPPSQPSFMLHREFEQ